MNGPPDNAFVQISKAQADTDCICVTIMQDPKVHLRVELSLADFADAITGGRKVIGKVVRWRIDNP